MGFSGCIFNIIIPPVLHLLLPWGTSIHSALLMPSLCLFCFSSYQGPSCPERGGNPHHEVPTMAKDGWSKRIGVSITTCGCFQTTRHGRTPSYCWGELGPIASPAAQPQ